jgi:hypothetical protein
VGWNSDDDTDDGRPQRRGVSVSVDVRPPFIGVIAIAIGAAILFHQIFGSAEGVFSVAIGLYLVVRCRSSAYPLFVIGAVMVGSGAGDLVADVVSGSAHGALGTFGAAAAFLWLANVDRPRSSWAMIPAAILGLLGVFRLGLSADALAGGGGGWLLPAGVVVAGIMLLGAHRMPRPLRLAGLVFVIAAALSLLSHDNQNRVDGRVGVLKAPQTTLPGKPTALGDLTGQTLTVSTDNGAIRIDEGDGAATVTAGRAVLTRTADGVELRSSLGYGSWQISVPAGTKVVARSESGSITVNVADLDLDLETANGPISVLQPATMLVAKTGSGAINAQLGQLEAEATARLETANGVVVLTVAGDPTVTATSNNGVVVATGFDGDDTTADRSFAHAGSDGRVKIKTGSGSITVTRTDAAVPAGRR